MVSCAKCGKNLGFFDKKCDYLDENGKPIKYCEKCDKLYQKRMENNKKLIDIIQDEKDKNRIKKMTHLIEEGANVNYLDKKNDTFITPLLAAVRENDIESVKFFLSKGADVNKGTENGYTPISTACLGGSRLFIIKETGYFEIVKILIEKGASVNVKSKKEGWSPILLASSNVNFGESMDIINLLLKNGADPNDYTKFGDTPLILCCDNLKDDCIEILLKNGAKPDAKDNNGTSPLHILCKLNESEYLRSVIQKLNENLKFHTNLEVKVYEPANDIIKKEYLENFEKRKKKSVELLLKHGANKELKDGSGRTPLHITCMKNNMEIAKILIDRGANVNCKENTGEAILMTASWLGNKEMVKLLLEAGAHVNVKKKSGENALMWANFKELISKELKEKGHMNDIAKKWKDTAEKDTLSLINLRILGSIICDKNLNSIENGVDGELDLIKNNYQNYKEIVSVLKKAGAKM